MGVTGPPESPKVPAVVTLWMTDSAADKAAA